VTVIGARPARGAWFLGGGLRPRPRRVHRPRTRQRSAGRRIRARLDIRAPLVAIAAAAGLALFYLSQSGHVAATGYEIDRLMDVLEERRAERQQLVLDISRAQSPAEIARRAIEQLHLVPLEGGAVRYAPASIETAH
jgi:hypothetical protein